MRGLVALAIVAACGGKQAPPANDYPPVVEPAWATSYEQRAAAGCRCKDAACLEAVHGELAKVEADHGGMDDAPPGVQAAHGELDKCWRAGTKDPARDLDDSANQACGCTDATCLDGWKLDAMHLADKYAVTDLDALAATTPAGQAALARARKCVADDTITGPALLAIVQKATDTACACDNIGCVRTAMKERSDALARYFAVDDLAAVQPQLDDLAPKFCKCFGDLVAKEAVETLSPFPAATKIDVTMSCK